MACPSQLLAIIIYIVITIWSEMYSPAATSICTTSSTTNITTSVLQRMMGDQIRIGLSGYCYCLGNRDLYIQWLLLEHVDIYSG